MNESELPPLLERMDSFNDVVRAARDVAKWTNDIEIVIRELRWMAAGGRGMATREGAIERIDTQIQNLEALREQVEQLEDPRELREEARELERANHD